MNHYCPALHRSPDLFLECGGEKVLTLRVDNPPCYNLASPWGLVHTWGSVHSDICGKLVRCRNPRKGVCVVLGALRVAMATGLVRNPDSNVVCTNVCRPSWLVNKEKGEKTRKERKRIM